MTARNSSGSLRILIALGAFLLIAAAVTQSWFTNHVPRASFGLWGAEVCERMCTSARWDNVRFAGFEVVLVGYIATIASLASAVLALVSAFGAPSRALITRTLQLLTVALVAMGAYVVFVYAFGGVNQMTALSPNWGLFAGPAGALLALRLVRRYR
jgi:hypothetical protein